MADSFRYTFVDTKLTWSIGTSHNCLSFTSDGSTLAGTTDVNTLPGYLNGMIQFWNTANGTSTFTLSDWSFLAFSPVDPDLAVVLGPGGIQQLKRDSAGAATWRMIGSLYVGFTAPASTAAIRHDGRSLIVAQNGGTAFWTSSVASSGLPFHSKVFVPPSAASTFAYCPSSIGSDTIVFGCIDGQVQIRTPTGSYQSTLLSAFPSAGSAKVSACAWSQNSRWIATGDAVGEVRLWNAASTTNVSLAKIIPQSASGPIASLIFVKESTALIIISGNTLAVWDIANDQYVSNSGLPTTATNIAWDDARNRLAVVGLDLRVTLYELKEREQQTQQPRRKPRKTTTEIPPDLAVFDISQDVVKSKPDPYDGLYFDIYRGAWKLDKPRIFQHVVAIKALRPRFNPSSKAQERQDFEDLLTKCIKTWLDLTHANLVPLLGVSMNFGNFPAMVTSWMINGLLSEYIKSDEEHDEMQLVIDVASGVEFLHSQNIVHSDIRASSFLVDELGVARLADPGLLNVLVDSPLMKSGNISLPYRWMAPELINKSVNKANASTDVYSVTMTSLEIFTKKPPYQGVDDALVPSQILQGQRPSRPDDVAEGLWGLWGQGWNQDASRRPNMANYVQRLNQLSD